MLEELSDQQIISMIQRGGIEQSEALRYIYIQKKAKLVAGIRRRARDLDAEDIYHEAVVNLVEAILDKRFKGQCTLSTFLFAIANKLCLKHFDRKGRDEKYQARYFGPQMDPIDPEVLLITEEVKEGVREALGQLKPKNREILMLWMSKYSMAEIAQKMGYESEAVARVTKSRSLSQLVRIIRKNKALKNLLDELV